MKYTAKYRHLRRSYDNVLYATICTIQSEDIPGRYGYGIAICGDKENFARGEGRKKAFRRAVKALMTNQNALPIRNLKVRNVLTFLDENPQFQAFPFKSFTYTSVD